MAEDYQCCPECGEPDGTDWCDECFDPSCQPIPRSAFLRARMARDLAELRGLDGVTLTDAEEFAGLPEVIQEAVLDARPGGRAVGNMLLAWEDEWYTRDGAGHYKWGPSTDHESLLAAAKLIAAHIASNAKEEVEADGR